MSWQIMLLNIANPSIGHMMDIVEEGLKLSSFGNYTKVKEKINTTLPKTQWENDSSGWLEEEDTVIDFDLGKNETVSEIILTVRGENDLEYVSLLCEANDWTAFDCGTGELIFD